MWLTGIDPAVGAGDGEQEARHRLEPVAQRDQQPVRPLQQRGQQALAVRQGRLELDAGRDLGALPGREHRPVVQPLRPALRGAAGGAEAGQHAGRRQPRVLPQRADAQVPQLESARRRPAAAGSAGWPARKARCAAGISSSAAFCEATCPATLAPNLLPVAPSAGCQPRLRTVGRQRLAPLQELAFDARRVARRRGGRGVQVDPAQAVRLPAVGVGLDAVEELLLGLPEREAGGRAAARRRDSAPRPGVRSGQGRRRPAPPPHPPPAPGRARRARPAAGRPAAAPTARATAVPKYGVHRIGDLALGHAPLTPSP